MKRFMLVLLGVCAVSISVLAAPVQGAIWQKVPFTHLQGGAISYDATGDNVVVAGTAFYDAIHAPGSSLGTQLVGGDGINKEVAGNFAMYGVFTYTDTDNVWGWAMAHPNTTLALEVRAWGVGLDVTGDGKSDLTEHFTLDAKDMPGVDYLTATFAELAGWGYTEVAPNVWLDIAVIDGSTAALSVVMDGYTEAGLPDMNARLLDGEGGLIQYWPPHTPGSGLYVAAVPEPASLIVWSLFGAVGVAFGWRRRRAA